MCRIMGAEWGGRNVKIFLIVEIINVYFENLEKHKKIMDS